MPDTKDLLEQLQEMRPERRQKLAMDLFETFPIAFHPAYFLKFQWPDFPSIVSTPNVCGGSPRLIRTRIPLWVLHRMRQLDFPEAKILESYPTLTAADLVQAWDYIAMHKAEIEKEIEENERD